MKHGLPTAGTDDPPSGAETRPSCVTGQKANRGSRVSAWFRAALGVPGALLSLLPSANCPLCMAAYAGILSTLGLGFLFTERVLACLVPVFLVVGVASIAWTLPAHGRKAPLLIAVIASVLIVSGRLVWSAPTAVYLGAPLFLAAAGWNFWLRMKLIRREKPA